MLATVAVGVILAAMTELVSSQGRTGGGPDATVSSDTEESVRAYLDSNPVRLMDVMPAVELRRVQTPVRSGGSLYTFDYIVEGARVAGIRLLVTVDATRRVTVRATYPEPLTFIRRSSAKPVLGQTEAVRAAMREIGDGSSAKVTAGPEAVWSFTPEGFRRATRIVIDTVGPRHQWEVIVDAYTGELIRKADVLDPEGVRAQ